MPDSKDPGSLLDTARSTFVEEIQPVLPGGQRYAGAMIANALGIARRRIAHADPGAALLARLGAGDDIDLAALAQDIRAGRVSDETHEGLAAALFDYVAAELEITNPNFLRRRR